MDRLRDENSRYDHYRDYPLKVDRDYPLKVDRNYPLKVERSDSNDDMGSFTGFLVFSLTFIFLILGLYVFAGEIYLKPEYTISEIYAKYIYAKYNRTCFGRVASSIRSFIVIVAKCLFFLLKHFISGCFYGAFVMVGAFFGGFFGSATEIATTRGYDICVILRGVLPGPLLFDCRRF